MNLTEERARRNTVTSGGAVAMPLPQSFYDGMGSAAIGSIITAVGLWWKRQIDIKSFNESEKKKLREQQVQNDVTLQVRLVEHTTELLQEDRARIGRLEDQLVMLRNDLQAERDINSQLHQDNTQLRQDNAKLQEINRELQAECRNHMQAITSLKEQMADKGLVE